ncbi:MAG: hypothetical protein ACXVAX_05695 [Pseudobdellovibrio sp.]
MDQKKLTILTLLVVVAGAVGINEMLIRKESKEQNREVASFGERFVPEQIKWEQELARSVSREAHGKTLIADRPSISEKFLYEALEGKYQAQVVNGKLLKITMIPNQEGVTLDTKTAFTKYAGVFKEAKSFESKTVDPTTEDVVLKNAGGQPIGNVTIHRNSEGRLLDLEIQ